MFNATSSDDTSFEPVPHFVNGQRWQGDSGRHGQVLDPSLGTVIHTVPFASRADVTQAVTSASSALPAWALLSPVLRARILFKARNLLITELDSFAYTIAEESGKTLANARAEVWRGIRMIEYACSIPDLLSGQHTQAAGALEETWSVREPIGVCAGITPANFPLMVPLWMAPIALACGNAFILKPSERSPSAPVQLGELFTRAGLPPGVFNIVHGGGETAGHLIDHPEVQAISFVGSTAVGKSVYGAATAQGKRAQAFGSAKNHAVILPDADLDHTSRVLIDAIFGSAGQRCMSVSVIVTVGEIADPFLKRFIPMAKAITVDSATAEHSGIGPLSTREHLERVRGYIDTGIHEGATLLVDGRDHPTGGEKKGFFIGPSIFDHVTPRMRIYQEEIFGPVLCVLRAQTFDDALGLVNSHPYGNGSAIFTRSGRMGHEFQQRAQAGMVGINVPVPVPDSFHSFGGWKQSRFGETAMYGPEGVRFFTKLKTVMSAWPAPHV